MNKSIAIVKVVYRDLKTGRFVTEQVALKNLNTTTREFVDVCNSKISPESF